MTRHRDRSSVSGGGDDEDDAAALSPVMSPVEALSHGRAKRSTAGNRMRELLEQERERIEAEGDGALSSRDAGSSSGRRPTKKPGHEEEEDDDDIFGEDEGDVDIDFQELAGADAAEDIIDSDFDQSSNDGNEEEAEDEGERQLIEEEKAAKKASRNKAKALPVHMRARPPKPALGEGSTLGPGESRPRKAKRIAFASTDGSNDVNAAAKRSSKRAATMQVTQTVQERMQQDEERRAKLREVTQPKRKKIRLSQADYIAEALEIEEGNRESLKMYLEREEERRERERRRSKRKMDGPFLRWRSFAVDGNAVHRHVLVKEENSEQDRAIVPTSEAKLLEDPAIAARKAAIAEKERQAAAQEAEQKRGVGGAEAHEAASRLETPSTKSAADGQSQTAGPPDNEHDEAQEQPAGSALANQEQTQEQPKASGNDEAQGDGRAQEAAIPAGVEYPAASTEKQDDGSILDNATSANDATINATTTGPAHETIPEVILTPAATPNRFPFKENGSTHDQVQVQVKTENLKPDWEGRATVSLHGIPAATPWPIVFTQVLGSHVDWARYPVVAARNRPLRPRQSVCPVTGLPARYRDPRSGIAYASREAYDILTQLMDGQYRWSCKPEALSREADAVKTRITNPLDLGCYMDRIDEPGACNALLTASAMMPQPHQGTVNEPYPAASLGSKASQAPRKSSSMVYTSGVLVAPGDEQAVMAAASELPAGSTRSGTRRSARGA